MEPSDDWSRPELRVGNSPSRAAARSRADPGVALHGATIFPDASRTRAVPFSTSRRSLSAVHVAEREHSRMAAGRHFVNDEEERRAVATIVATLGTARDATLRIFSLCFSPFFFLPSCETLASGPEERLAADVAPRIASRAAISDKRGGSGGQMCRRLLPFAVQPRGSRWKITERSPPRLPITGRRSGGRSREIVSRDTAPFFFLFFFLLHARLLVQPRGFLTPADGTGFSRRPAFRRQHVPRADRPPARSRSCRARSSRCTRPPSGLAAPASERGGEKEREKENTFNLALPVFCLRRYRTRSFRLGVG